jgi:hypothetical protein
VIDTPGSEPSIDQNSKSGFNKKLMVMQMALRDSREAIDKSVNIPGAGTASPA